MTARYTIIATLLYACRCVLPGRPTRDVMFNDALRDGHTLLKVLCLLAQAFLQALSLVLVLLTACIRVGLQL